MVGSPPGPTTARSARDASCRWDIGVSPLTGQMNHHCHFINNCIGHRNLKAFINFLVLAPCYMSFWSVTVLLGSIFLFKNDKKYSSSLLYVHNLYTYSMILDYVYMPLTHVYFIFPI